MCFICFSVRKALIMSIILGVSFFVINIPTFWLVGVNRFFFKSFISGIIWFLIIFIFKIAVRKIGGGKLNWSCYHLE